MNFILDGSVYKEIFFFSSVFDVTSEITLQYYLFSNFFQMKNIFFVIVSLQSIVVVVLADSKMPPINDKRLNEALWTAAKNAKLCHEIANILIDNHLVDEDTTVDLVSESKDYDDCIKRLSTLFGSKPDDSDFNQFDALVDTLNLLKKNGEKSI